MIISITSLKGGVGKSTLTQNLAVCFAHMDYKICIVDADANQSSLRWAGYRPDNLPKIMVSGQQDENSLLKNVRLLNNDYDIVLIDGTPSLSKTTSKLLLIADLVIIPILPSGLDFWATEIFIDRFVEAQELREKNIPAYFLLNQYDERQNLSKESKEALGMYEIIKCLENNVKSRSAYRKAIIDGLGVYEYNDPKAKDEMVEVANEIIQIMSKIS